MRMLARRKPGPALELRDRQRKARADAATLRASFPAALQVSVELTFDADASLEPAPQHFSVFPPAQAHFIYACAFGDCDGQYNLNEAAFSMLGSGSDRTSGTLRCQGHRSPTGTGGASCNLGVSFVLTARYQSG